MVVNKAGACLEINPAESVSQASERFMKSSHDSDYYEFKIMWFQGDLLHVVCWKC